MSMKRPNGAGSVYKLSGKRRKPWAARVTIGWNLSSDGHLRQVYQPLGTYASRIEAETALNNYLQNPYDIDAYRLTFSEVYDLWSAEYFPTLKNKSSVRTVTAAYNYCKPIYNMRFRDLRVSHLQGVIRDADVGDATKGRIKSLFNMMYKYALIHEICDKDYAALFAHKAGKRNKENRHPFKNSEIARLWEWENVSVVDRILFCLYSGFRPSEMLLLENKNVDFDHWTVMGGMKTEAGTDRTVPIHEKVRHIVKSHYDANRRYLFRNEKNEFMTYDQYRGRFKHIMAQLKMEHTPHETRHTFITCAKARRMDENLLKMIVGHEITDITEAVYTHRPLSDLVEAVALIDYNGDDLPDNAAGFDWD